MTTRTHPLFRSTKDFYLSLGPNGGGFPAEQSLPVAALVLDPSGGGRVARTRDGSHCFDVVELFSMLFSAMIVNRFRILTPVSHTPRVTVDRLVISRGAWSFTPSTAGFAFTRDESERFAQARQWTRRHGMPRFVFVRTPLEVKPVFVDFSSPVSVNILARLIRRLAASGPPDALVTLTKMLPDPSQAWLVDSDGNRYVSEFRLVSLDLA